MKTFLKLLSFCTFVSSGIIPAFAATCDDYVAALAPNDIFLGGRKDLATSLIVSGSTVQKFITALNTTTKSGDKYSCGWTRFWIDGIFVGSAKQYEELRRSKLGIGYGTEAGYSDLVGNKSISKLFQSYADLTDNFVFYKFQIAGVVDHVWAVLQMPGPKYKVYQSYNNAYSLSAWLSNNITGMYSKSPPGQIRYWDDVYNNFKNVIAGMGGNINANGTILFPSSISEPMKKWAQYVVDYNKDAIENNFKMAWSRFGQNKWIDADTFNRDYLDVLQTLMDTMRTMVGTTNPWTDDLNSKWIGLFASPNPVLFPTVPFNTQTMQYEQKLELQSRVEIVSMEMNSCYKNYLSMGKTIPNWISSFKSSATSYKSFEVVPLTLFVVFVTKYLCQVYEKLPQSIFGFV